MPRELPPTGSLEPRLFDLVGDPGVAFEAALAQWLDVPEVQVECSGTACLYIALEYLKTVSNARKVVILGYTCPLVAIAVHLAGLEVRVCDTAQDTLDFDFTKLRELLSDNTLCVIPTHWGGAIADVARLCHLVQAYAPRAYVLEDGAQAFGATVAGRTIGLAGHLGFFSFAAGKGLSLYEGGCLISRDPAIRVGLRATAARIVAAQPLWEAWRAMQLLAYHLFYRPLGLYLFYGLPRRHWLSRGDLVRALGDDQTAIPLHRPGAWRKRVGTCALVRYRAHLNAIRATHARIKQQLTMVPGLQLHPIAPAEEPSCTYVFITCDSADRAAALLRASARYGMGLSRPFAFAIDEYPCLQGVVDSSDLPNARHFAERCITLTTSPYMTIADESLIVGLIRRSSAY